jgi:hypothetical protein
MAYVSVEPVPGPEAFEDQSVAGQLSQAALLLSTEAGVSGRVERIERSEQFPLPELAELRSRKRLTVAEATDHLDVDLRRHAVGFLPEVATEQAPRIARELYAHPDPGWAASLIEASLHSPHQIVRVAAAAAALGVTRSRRKLREVLAEGARSEDELTKELAATALARVDPTNSSLAELVSEEIVLTKADRPSHTATLTHGTWGSAQAWYQPGGDFYLYLSGLNPALHLHQVSFAWSGAYSHARRQLAATELRDWLVAQGLNQPDFFAHSHGCTVANLATKKGVRFDRLVLLAWPVHEEWMPVFSRASRLIDIRVRFDLVIMADRGGQRFPSGTPVEEHINGWFSHPDPHDPAYWSRHGLAMAL